MEGWPTNLDLSLDEALHANGDYPAMMSHVDVLRVDGVRRDPEAVRRLFGSCRRNVAADAAHHMIGPRAEEPLGEPVLHHYPPRGYSSLLKDTNLNCRSSSRMLPKRRSSTLSPVGSSPRTMHPCQIHPSPHSSPSSGQVYPA